jgi:PHP family Zn ribbon phosphoesterase
MHPRPVEEMAVRNLNRKFQCQHDYPDETWKCSKCGYEIHPDVLGKIAETGCGRIMNTNV